MEQVRAHVMLWFNRHVACSSVVMTIQERGFRMLQVLMDKRLTGTWETKYVGTRGRRDTRIGIERVRARAATRQMLDGFVKLCYQRPEWRAFMLEVGYLGDLGGGVAVCWRGRLGCRPAG